MMCIKIPAQILRDVCGYAIVLQKKISVSSERTCTDASRDDVPHLAMPQNSNKNIMWYGRVIAPKSCNLSRPSPRKPSILWGLLVTWREHHFGKMWYAHHLQQLWCTWELLPEIVFRTVKAKVSVRDNKDSPGRSYISLDFMYFDMFLIIVARVYMICPQIITG